MESPKNTSPSSRGINVISATTPQQRRQLSRSSLSSVSDTTSSTGSLSPPLSRSGSNNTNNNIESPPRRTTLRKQDSITTTTTSSPTKNNGQGGMSPSSAVGRRLRNSGGNFNASSGFSLWGWKAAANTTTKGNFLRQLLMVGAFTLCCQIAVVSYHHYQYVNWLLATTESEDSPSILSTAATDRVGLDTTQKVSTRGSNSNSGRRGRRTRQKRDLALGATTTTTTTQAVTTPAQNHQSKKIPPFSPLYNEQQHPVGLPPTATTTTRALTTKTADTADDVVVVDVIFEPKVSSEEYFQWVPPHHGSEAAFLQIRPNLGVAIGGFSDDYSSVTSSIQFLNIGSTSKGNNNKWSTMPLPKDIAETHSAVAYDDEQQWLYIVSGQKGGACLPAVKTGARVYIPSNNPAGQKQRVEYLPDLPKALFGASGAILTSPDHKKRYLHVFGGVKAETRRDVSLDHWRLEVYPTLGNQWEVLEGPPDAGLHSAAKVYNNTIYYTAFCANDFALNLNGSMKECRKHDFEVSDTHHTSRHGLMFKYDASSASSPTPPTWERLQDMPLGLSHTGNIVYKDKLWYFFGGVQTQLVHAGGPILPEGTAQAFDFTTQQWHVLPHNLTETISNPYVWITNHDDQDNDDTTVTLMRPHEWHKKGTDRPYSKMIVGKFQQHLDNNNNKILTEPERELFNTSNQQKSEQQMDYLRTRKLAVRRETTERFLSCLTDDIDTCHPFWSTSYESLRTSWNLAYEELQHPDLVCLPTSESQISAIVQCARRGGQAVCARSGKHSFSGDTCTYGVVIDTGAFMDIERLDHDDDPDSDKNLWRIGAGNKLGRVSYELSQQGYVLPAGHCPSVGLSGLILAGGQGPLSRLYGMTSDFVAGVRYVDWQGNIVEATATNEHKDALWLARGGGGGQFAFPGIITDWKLQDIPRALVPPSKPVYTTWLLDFRQTPENAERLMENYQDFLLDPELAADPYINHLTVEVWIANWVKNMPEDPTRAISLKRVKGRRVLKIIAYFYGDDKMNRYAERHFYPRLRNLANGLWKTKTKRQDYLEFQRDIGGVQNNEELVSGVHGWNLGDKWKGYSAVASDKVPGSVFRDLAASTWEAQPSTFRYTEIKPLRGAISTKLNKEDSAFWHRDALFWSLSSHFWKAPESTSYVQSILEESSQMHRRYEEGMGQSYGGSYAGYKDPGSVVRSELERYNGANADKIATVRKLLDPSNVFRHYLPNNKLTTSPPTRNSIRSLLTIDESKAAPRRRKARQEAIKEGEEQRSQGKSEISEGKLPSGWESTQPVEEATTNGDPSLTAVQSTIQRDETQTEDAMNDPSGLETLPLDQATTFTMLRSIGNALPPRHSPEQTITNLKFTLSMEASFPNVVKHWLVNRLVNETIEQQVIELLEAYKQNYTVVPFNLSEYSDLENNWDIDHEGTDFVHRITVLQNEEERWMHRTPKPTHLFLEGLEKPKNLYVTNVNGGRNHMLDIGLDYGTDWIMPLDGNSFFTPESFEDVRQGVLEFQDKSAYMMLPMVRVLASNEDQFSENGNATEVQAVSEPQLIFRKDATARFNLNLWYSRRDKLELLWRLGAKAPGLEPKHWRRWEAKYQDIMVPISDKPESVPMVGFVYRLNSGRSDLDMTDDKMGSKAMMFARAIGVSLLLSQLDTRVVRELDHYDASNLVYLHAHLNAARALPARGHSCPDLLTASQIAPELALAGGAGSATNLCLDQAFTVAKDSEHREEMFEKLLNETVRLPHLVDAVRILQKKNSLTAKSIGWVLKKYLRWLERSSIGKQRFTSCGSAGVRYDVHVTAVAGFLDKVEKLVWYLDRSMSRLLLVDEEGLIPSHCEEEDNGNPGDFLTAWSVLARLSETHHRSNLWTAYPSHVTGDSALCRMASYYLKSSEAGEVVVDENAMSDIVANCPKIRLLNNNIGVQESSPVRTLEENPSGRRRTRRGKEATADAAAAAAATTTENESTETTNTNLGNPPIGNDQTEKTTRRRRRRRNKQQQS